MSKTRSSHVGFLNFFKLNLLYGVALGQLAGLWFLCASLCGGPVHLNLGLWHIEGIPAGIGALVLLPPAFGIIFLAAAPIVFLPFRLACQLFGGFNNS